MRKSNIIAILSTASLASVAPGHAADVTLDYHLPEVKIGFAVSHMITACPNGNGLEGFAMDTLTAIKPVYGRGKEIRINPKGNPFVDRQVKLEFHENGTIKSFNGSSTGQGGKIIAAAIKAASFAVTAAAGVPIALAVAPHPIPCTPKIEDLLKQRGELEAQLASLKQALIGHGSSNNLLLQITRTEAALADTLARLTVSPNPAIWTPTAGTDPMSDSNLTSPAKADLTVWFAGLAPQELQAALDAAGYGQVLDFKASITSVKAGEAKPAPTTVQRALVYREPGAVTVTLEPRSKFLRGSLTGTAEALARAAYEGTKAKETVKVPQIGTLKVIRFDGSGIFGSRAVAATFAQTGDVTSIGYTSTGGADALAGVLDAAVAAGIEQRDLETNATKREVERRAQASALEALIEAEAKAKKEQEDAAAAAAVGD